MELDTDPKREKFKNFDDTYPLCTFALAFGFMYPNRTNIKKRAITITLIVILNGGQLFWFCTYSYKCFSTLDLYNLARNLTMAVIVALFFIKTYYAINATHQFSAMLIKMSSDLLKGNVLDENYGKIYEKHIRQGKVAEKLWLLIPVILSAQFPIYAGTLMSIDSIKSDNFTRMMVHDMELLFVEHIQSETPFFECMFAYNCLQCIVLVPNFTGFDGSFCIATIHLRMKLKLMTERLRRAYKDARNKIELRAFVCEAIIDHQDALEFHKQIQNVYGPWLFAIFMLTSTMISFNLYQIYLLQRIDIKYTMFGIVGVLHIYLPCRYASELTKTGREIASEIYDVPWEKVIDTGITKLLIFMIARAQKDLILTGNGVVVYNMELFKSIMQASYSFFTLITS